MKHVLAASFVFGLACLSTAASAQESEEKTVTVRPTVIHGRAHLPSVVIDVAKARMQLPVRTPTLAAGHPPSGHRPFGPSAAASPRTSGKPQDSVKKESS